MIATGHPWASPKAITSAPAVTGPSLPGTTGTPAAAAVVRADSLSPMRSIASGGGPTNVTPRAVMARAKSAFSEKNP